MAWLVSISTMPSADFSAVFALRFPEVLSVLQIPQRPPGVSSNPCLLMCRIYPPFLRMTFGRPDLWVGYPERQASYPVSVRHIKTLSMASFRSHLTMGTLAFDYGIPVIRAPWGLVKFFHAPVRFTACPAHQYLQPLRGINIPNFYLLIFLILFYP